MQSKTYFCLNKKSSLGRIQTLVMLPSTEKSMVATVVSAIKPTILESIQQNNEIVEAQPRIFEAKTAHSLT